MGRKLEDVEFYEESDAIVKEVKDYVQNNYSGRWLTDELLDQIQKEAFQIVIDYLEDNFDPVDDIMPYVETAMMYVNVREIIDFTYTDTRRFRYKDGQLKEVGLNMWDFIDYLREG